MLKIIHVLIRSISIRKWAEMCGKGHPENSLKLFRK